MDCQQTEMGMHQRFNGQMDGEAHEIGICDVPNKETRRDKGKKQVEDKDKNKGMGLLVFVPVVLFALKMIPTLLFAPRRFVLMS
jgi:hypothetical protein